MKPFEFTISDVLKGDTINAITINDIQQDETPVDLSNVNIKMHVRNAGDTLMYSAEKGNGITLNGINSITVEPFIVKNVGLMKADIQFTFPDGVVRTWFYYTFKVCKDLTQ